MKKLPVHHISVRVPWHDNKWNGCVCKDPANNASCMLYLPRMADKDPDLEEQYIDQHFSEIPEQEIPSCLGEMVSFMSDKEITVSKEHPYVQYGNELFSEFKKTPLTYPPYSFSVVPFQWMLKNRDSNQNDKAEALGLDYDSEREPDLRFANSWVQNIENQKVMLESFRSALVPEDSLVFIYAKNIPLIENSDRILIGVGRIKKCGEVKEYNYSTDAPSHRSFLWERPIFHTIREDEKDGFLIPYHEILELYKNGEITDVEPYIARASNWEQFSYGSELVDNDSAIDAILSIRAALINCTKVLDQNYDKQFEWIDRQLSRLWDMRGAFPGLGPVLHAFGVSDGNILAWEISRYISQTFNNPLEADPWDYVENVFQGEELPFTSEVSSRIGETINLTWNDLPAEKKEYLRLLSRLSINNDHAGRLYKEKEYSTILDNPYRIFENSRLDVDSIAFKIVDKAVFPPEKVRSKFPLQAATEVKEPNDKRRVRALLIDILEGITEGGDTVSIEDTLLQAMDEYDIEPSCPVTSDILSALKNYLESDDDTLSVLEADARKFYKLKRYKQYKDTIFKAVYDRIHKARRIKLNVDWEEAFENNPDYSDPNTGSMDNIHGKSEKVAALKEIGESRFSVLIGPAGSGKTSMLKMFFAQDEIAREGVLKLAPTGKARVQMGIEAKTIAQFLLNPKRYDGETGRYFPNPEAAKYGEAENVVIDEASMLTEDQLVAIFDAVPNAKRYILVGDYRQLPPIGAGKPFFDIVQYLKPAKSEELVGKGYAELKTTFRQGHSEGLRNDVEFANLFSDNPIRKESDEIFTKVQNSGDDNIDLVRWNSVKELQEKLCQTFSEEFEDMDSPDDFLHFEASYGGSTPDNTFNFFNQKDAVKAEDWQILTPLRTYGYGVRELNRFIQSKYRSATIEKANRRSWQRSIPRPVGDEAIVYGDKVINTRNNRWRSIYPEDDNAFKYIANGEIGVVTGVCRKQWKGERPTQICFTSQPDYQYKFFPWNFQEDGQVRMELAYAITVHKSQGSGFKKVFLIIPNPCNFLSRELLYTALTRQKEKVVIFHQGDFNELRKFTSDVFSETANRLTDLMETPIIREIGNRTFDGRYINVSARDEPMISKSEVIIANLMKDKGIQYVYEKPFIGNDGRTVKPDFTIENNNLGITFLWEHLGMLSADNYREKWELKREWYIRQGVLPLEGESLPDSDYILLTTKDNPEIPMGGIDSNEIMRIIGIIQ